MARFLKSREMLKGKAPGSLIFTGVRKMEQTRIRLFSYDEDAIRENTFEHLADALNHLQDGGVNWLNIDGMHDVELLKQIGQHFGLSNLTLENILNTGQRARFIEEQEAIALITKAVYYDEVHHKVTIEQISFVLLGNTLISFQEQVGDHFEGVRERIRNKSGRIRQNTADYLLYALTDSLVDNYLINLEQLGSYIESMEQRMDNPNKKLSVDLFHCKTEITFFRKVIRPLKEALTRLLRADDSVIEPNNMVYYQELFDIQEQAIEAADNYFGVTNDLINLYNTNLSNKVNDVMKVLTIFASIFIPLTFIAGIYGTNFSYVPELEYRYSYFIMWGVMIVVAGVMLYYFRKNRWF
jgi:magnesium transporter